VKRWSSALFCFCASQTLLLFALLTSLAVPAATAQKQKPDYVTDEEEDKIRDAQEPSERIEVYLTLAQSRLDRIQEFRSKPMDPQYDNGAYIDHLLDAYISLTDDLKNWIQDKYDRRGDMRKGLRKVLEMGPKQLDDLRRIQESSDAYAADYAKSLRNAKDDLTDALDGATKALADQVKMLGELKTDEKAAAQAEKDRIKEEKKRSKEEEKLRKKERKQNPPEEDQD
jgi:septal ring factor EnvC (AmiA/AmiB activator)